MVKRSRLSKSSRLKTTGAYSMKRYRCTRCGRIELRGTNHWGDIYPQCAGCSWKNPLDPFPVWKCLEKMPKGYTKPAPWKKVRLGDIAEIVKVKS
jgi:DNA-directed RNA polymerase subunit RPC12/RpoP